MRSEKQKMLAGELYHADDPELERERVASRAWMARYNATLDTSESTRLSILRELLGAVGDDVIVLAILLRLWLQHPTGRRTTRAIPAVRRGGAELGRPVSIGRNVIGGAAIILPGIRIGDDAIIGAGSVVTGMFRRVP